MIANTVFLFDLDGTLVETAPDLSASFNKVIQTRGATPLPPEEFRKCIGGGSNEMFERSFSYNNINYTAEEKHLIIKEFIADYHQNISKNSYIYNGINTILTQANQAGIKCAVVTNKQENLAQKLLIELDLWKQFDTLIGCNTCNHEKPHPEPMLEAIKRLNSTPQSAIMVGDTQTDIQAAKNANIPCICVSFGYANPPLTAKDTNILIDDYSQFYDALATIKPEVAQHIKQMIEF